MAFFPFNQDLFILPGGQPGTNNLKACGKLRELLADANEKGKLLAAICAAPTVFGDMGLLKGKSTGVSASTSSKPDARKILTFFNSYVLLFQFYISVRRLRYSAIWDF